MKVSFLPADLDAWLRPLSKPPRSPGLHVSTVLTAMLKEAAPRHFGHYGNTSPNRRTNWLLGNLWEEAFERIVREQQIDPPGYVLQPKRERVLDGIYLTPDRTLVSTENFHIVIDETKFTWLSVVPGLGDDPNRLVKTNKYAYWVCQSKTYAAASQELQDRDFPGHTAPTPDARIVVMFVNADYAAKHEGVMTAVYRWRLQFERDELRQWWANVRDYATKHAEELYEPGESGPRRDPDPGQDPGGPGATPEDLGGDGGRAASDGEPADR